MKINIERPPQTTFGKLSKGRAFEINGSIYIKGIGDIATAIHKNSGLMNAGECEVMREDLVVQYVTEITFKVG